MSIEHQDVSGLEEDEKTILYLYHKLWPEDKHKVVIGQTLLDTNEPLCLYLTGLISNDSTVLNNPTGIVIPTVCEVNHDRQINCNKEDELAAFKFIVDYLGHYANNSDKDTIPKKAANSETFKEWLNNPIEMELFGRFSNINETTDLSKTQLRELTVLVLMANYLGMNGLLHKCCYLIGYAIKGKNPEVVNSYFT